MSTSACLEFIFVVFTALHQADVSRVFLCNLRMIDFNVFLHLLHCNIKYIVLCLHTPYTFLSEFLYLYKLHTISFSLNILLLNFVHLMKQLTRDRLLSYLHIICMFIHFFFVFPSLWWFTQINMKHIHSFLVNIHSLTDLLKIYRVSSLVTFLHTYSHAICWCRCYCNWCQCLYFLEE